MNIYRCIIIFLFIISIYKTFRHQVGIDNLSKGFGKYKESTSVLLDRIQWSNHYNDRKNISMKMLFFSIIINFFTYIIYISPYEYNISNTIKNYEIDYCLMLQGIIVVWLILMCFNSYFLHHADKFDSYFIDKNINYIRKKLKLKLKSEYNTKLKINKLNKKYKNECLGYIY